MKKIWILLAVVLANCQGKYHTPIEKNVEIKPKLITVECNISDSVINTKDIQLIIDPLWSTVDIYQTHDIYLGGLKQFSENQKLVFAIQWYQAEVNNGGHDQFFYNSTGIVWEDALQGFKKFELPHYYDILYQAVLKMGKSPPFNREARIEILDSIKPDFDSLDTQFYQLEKKEPIDSLLFNFIDRNRQDFYFKGKIERPENAY